MIAKVLIVHFLTCLLMTGVIWVIQLVHYPSFAYIAPNQFETFNRFHQNSISYVVMPLMLLELFSSFALVYFSPGRIDFLLLAAMLGLIWLSTFLLSVPLHEKLLGQGYNKDFIAKLVNTNWPRTILWSLRSIWLLFIVMDLVK